MTDQGRLPPEVAMPGARRLAAGRRVFVATESFAWMDGDDSFAVHAGVTRVAHDHPILSDSEAARMFVPFTKGRNRGGRSSGAQWRL